MSISILLRNCIVSFKNVVSALVSFFEENNENLLIVKEHTVRAHRTITKKKRETKDWSKSLLHDYLHIFLIYR